MTLLPRVPSTCPRPSPVFPARSAPSRPRGFTAGIHAPAPLCLGAPTSCVCSGGGARFSATIPRARARFARTVGPRWRLPGPDGPGGSPSACSPMAAPSAGRPGHGSWPGKGYGPGRIPGGAWGRRPRRLTPPLPKGWGARPARQAAAARTAPARPRVAGPGPSPPRSRGRHPGPPGQHQRQEAAQQPRHAAWGAPYEALPTLRAPGPPVTTSAQQLGSSRPPV
jgi:hypothetical protein